ncbi:unnamed protein product [Somion occarium]|uniref:Csf1 N-terminal domain-containing protein n=1 Tax=Somion occarium TaxID=3059160 RepID=A0ABP1DIX8_9APHY
MLDSILLVVCICIVVGVVAYLFYFNRLIGFLLGLFCKLAFWNSGESSIWVSIGSIHFSILAGRISFKDLRYHSANQTILVVKGQISWRYWIRAPAEEDDLSHARVIGEGAELKPNTPLSCRVNVSLRGLEWFIYNRTAAYDNIISAMESSAAHSPEQDPARPSGEGRASVRKIFSRGSAAPDSSILGPPGSLISSLYRKAPTFLKRASSWIHAQLPNLDPRDLLPVGLEASTAAITCGNPSTPNLLVVEFSKASGTYGIVPARSKHDLYKQVLNLTFRDASICYVDNNNYQGNMSEEGRKVRNSIRRGQSPLLRRLSYLSFPIFQKLWRHLKLWRVAADPFSRPIKPIFPHPAAAWNRRKAAKSAEDATPVGADFSTLEYAKESKILECPRLELLYYADVVGIVPVVPEATAALDPQDIGNGDLPPEWGIDLALNGGSLRYGPWADRQRVHLQQTFMPSAFTDTTPNPHLKTGDVRVWTNFKVFLELREGVVLQVPFREASKNWMWDGKVEVPNRPRIREAASIHVKTGDTSTISYLMPMVANAKGYEPTLEVHLDTVSVTTSLNDIRLLQAESCRVRGELPSPLCWKDARQWTFAITFRHPTIYLLRDHVNMLTDLGRDWSAGPPSGYHRFIPMLYAIELDLQGYEINTYVNDQNIIDKPLIREENALLTLRGTRLMNTAKIPLTKFRPVSTAVAFFMDAPDIAVSLSLPRWNTHNLYPGPHRSDIGRVGRLRLDGSYRYYAEVHPEYVDQLVLDFTARDIVYKACGWTMRHFMILRDNYFGTFTHFSTLIEYLQKHRAGRPVGDPIDLQYRAGTSNSIHVQLGFDLDYGVMVVPAGLPGYEVYNLNEAYNLDNIDIGASLVLVLPTLQLQLRTHQYYMEMSLDIDTIFGHVQEHLSERLVLHPTARISGNEDLVLDGLHINANRLFGPQPHTSTYVCIWEIQLLSVKGILSTLKARILQAAGSAFGFGFSDPLNAPAAEFAIPSDPDVTFLKISLGSANIVWIAPDAAVDISLPSGMRFESNDAAGKSYAKVTSVRVPSMTAKTLLASPSLPNVWYEAAEFAADAYLDIYSAPTGWREKATVQTAFIAAQDSLTRRIAFLYDPEANAGPGRHSLFDTDMYLPSIRVPKWVPSPANARSPQPHTKPYGLEQSRVLAETESEDEEGSQVVNLDVKLANSHPPRRVKNSDEGESMSSGDESDNDDLTDFESDSEDTASIDHARSTWSPLRECAKWAARYWAPALRRPSLWKGSPYTLERRNPVSRFRTPVTKTEPIESPFMRSIVKEDVLDAYDVTVFRFNNKLGIRIQVTPLLLSALKALTMELSTNRLSPELRIDAVVASHVKSLSSPMPSTPSCMAFDARVQTIELDFTQPYAELHRTPSESRGNSPDLGHHLSTIGLRVVGLSAKGERVSTSDSLGGFALHSALDTLCFHLRGFPKPNVPVEGQDREPLLKLKRSSLSIARKNVSASLGQTQIELNHALPELAASSMLSILQFIQRVSIIFKESSTSMRRLSEDFLFDIIHSSRGKPIMDSLSTFQPSYLIQSGRPRQIRTDLAFKYIVHLRLCLHHLESSQRQSLHHTSQEYHSTLTLEQIKSEVEEQLLQAGMDFEADAFPLQAVFPDTFPDTSSPSTEAGDGGSSATVRIEFLQFGILLNHDATSFRTEFRGRELVLSGSTRRAQWMQSSSPTKNTMAWSSHDNVGATIRQIVISVSFGDVYFMLYPQILPFVQNSIRAAKAFQASHLEGQDRSDNVDERLSTGSTPHQLPMSVDVVLTSKSFRVKAAAEKLIIDYAASGVLYTSTTVTDPLTVTSTNQSLSFSQLKLQACSTMESTKLRESSVLALLTLQNGGLSTLFKAMPHSASSLKVVFKLGGAHLNVPRSAMRLYRFAEEWKADYFPSFDATMRAMLSELRGKRQNGGEQPVRHEETMFMTMHSEVTSLRVSLQVMRGTWLSWEICRTLAYFTSPEPRKNAQSFGLQIGSQNFTVQSRSKGDSMSDIQVKFDLPTFTLTGHHDGKRIHSLALVEFFHFTIKPSHWDTLLTVQQKFGNDFNDLLVLIEETRGRKDSKPSPLKPTSSWKYDIFVRVQGFRIGLEDRASTLFLECEDITGGISDDEAGYKRQLKLFDLALSLAPQSAVVNSKSSFDRDRRSAFVIIDSQVIMHTTKQRKHLEIMIAKIHAVMQPSSIGELGDFVDHLQEQRANELAEFREKTRSVIRTFDMKIGETQRSSDFAWWDEYNIDLAVGNVGIAFPLAVNQDLQLPRSGSIDSTAVRAFLFSTKSVVFGAEHGESGQVMVKDFSFQFVPSFRQSVGSDFSGPSHSTRNRLIYPEMTAKLKVERLMDSRRIRIGADVDGFILDVDSSMPDYVFSLINVYREGKERVSKLASTMPRLPTEVDAPTHPRSVLTSDQYDTILTSNLLASMVFASGKVRMYSKLRRPDVPRTKSASSILDGHESQNMEHGADIFNLPVVSVWCEYRATPAAAKTRQSNHSSQASILLFKSTIHSSQNSLRPTLLPFLTEFIDRIETHLRRSSSKGSHVQISPLHELHGVTHSTPVEKPNAVTDTVSSMQISLSLRIDQSRLELTCQPDVNVVGGLHWDSGGFVVNISPGARQVTFTGSVGGLTAGLKHGFLSEDCAKLDARNLAFTMTFAKVDLESGKSTASISVVLDTEFSGAVRFSRLQDVLCFKAVWLDRIPLLTVQESTAPSTMSRSPSDISVPEPPKEELVTAVLIRLRSVKLNLDFGQSITSTKLTLKNTLVRTKVSDLSAELSFSVASFAVVATGNLSGLIRVPDFRFETTRRNESASRHDKNGVMLYLSMTSGPLDIELDSEYHKLLLYRADSFEVMIFDDWSKITGTLPSTEQQVDLQFTVTGTDVLAVMNVGTIPKLVTYANKFRANLEAQREGASRESQAFRTAFSSEPDNPLSAVANAMLNTAKNRMKEAESGLTCVVVQRLSLKLKFLHLVVFPRSMRDVELARFIASDVHAHLDRTVESDLSPANRELQLSFSSMSISRMGQLNYSLVTREKTSNCKEWLASLLKGASEATIFGLPSMNMWMLSEEITERNVRTLVYDFSSTFTAKNGSKDPEDIYITLNMSLYSWLTVLRKTFAREMDQVQASADTRNTTNGAAPSMSSFQRKRATADIAGQSNHLELPELSTGASKTAPPLSHSRSHSVSTPSASSRPDDLSLSSPNPAASLNGGTSSSLTARAIPEEGAARSSDENKRASIVYKPRSRHIERLTMRQLGEATPDVMHPFFMKKAGFSLEDSLPQYVHEYATLPTEEIMKVLLRLYSRQLKVNQSAPPK